MRVCLDTSPLLNGHAARGIGGYTRQLLRALREYAPPSEPLVVQATHEVGGVVVEPARSFDVLHYPFFDLFFSTLPPHQGIATVVTVHDVIPLLFPHAYPPGIKGRWRFWGQRRRLQKVEAVLTDSEASKRDIIRHLHIPAARVHVVPLAARPMLQSVSEYKARVLAEKHGFPDRYMTYIGDINHNKNVATLLLALTQLPPSLHLCVVSQTFSDTSIPEGKRLADIIAANDLRDRVHVYGFPIEDDESVAALLQRSECLVQPSLAEGFGLPVLEAMQVGTVVVSSTAGSLPEVAGDAAIQVEPTLVGLVDGITQACSLRGAARQAYIDRGRAHAATFTWAATAAQTYAVYEEARRLWLQKS